MLGNKRLGEGGIACVWPVTDKATGEQLAMKVGRRSGSGAAQLKEVLCSSDYIYVSCHYSEKKGAGHQTFLQTDSLSLGS